MSEIRQDPITGRYVIIAEGRSARPDEYRGPPPGETPPGCPFCAGHESSTPAELAAYRPVGSAANGPGWSVRTIPNKFPTVAPDPTPLAVDVGAGEVRRAGFGLHEVVIESPAHSPTMPQLPAGQLREVFRMIRERVRAVAAHPGIGAVVTFENTGPESGGSLSHPHAQIVALGEIPPLLVEESQGLGRYSRTHGGVCAWEAELARERAAGSRVVWDTPELVAYAPFASSYPYEARFLPARHAPSLGHATDAELDRLTEMLPGVLRALLAVVPGASYNFVASSYASGRPEEKAHHWHLDLLPRLVRPDGFDVGGGIPVNIVAPERAASELRAALGFTAPVAASSPSVP